MLISCAIGCSKAMREEAVAMACFCKAGFERAALVLLAVMAHRIGSSDAVTNPADSKCAEGLSFSLWPDRFYLISHICSL